VHAGERLPKFLQVAASRRGVVGLLPVGVHGLGVLIVLGGHAAGVQLLAGLSKLGGIGGSCDAAGDYAEHYKKTRRER
jgi:hypothetical protein